MPNFTVCFQNVTSIISFGGWISSPSTGGSSSSGFPLALASPDTITDFVSGVTDLVDSLDGVGGVEFDWEYTGCSTDTPYTDPTLSTAYLTFLQQLRASLSPNVTISLAVGVVPFEVLFRICKSGSRERSADPNLLFCFFSFRRRRLRLLSTARSPTALFRWIRP